MSDRTLRRLAWTSFGGVSALFVFGFAFWFLHAPAIFGSRRSLVTNGVPELLFEVSVYAFALVGGLIATRRPRNTIGWLFLAIALAWGLGTVLTDYAIYGELIRPGSLAGPRIADALSQPLWVPAVGLLGTFSLLLFPDGHLPSPGWRFLARATVVILAASFLVILFAPATLQPAPDIRPYPNPLGVGSIRPLLEGLSAMVALIPLCIVGSAWALVRRFRRSRGVERLQLTWLASAAAVVAAAYLVVMLATLSFGWSSADVAPTWVNAAQSGVVLTFCLIPIAAGFAILRHRLYDIEVVINKAVVYGSLAAFITAVYVGIVVGVGRAVGTGGTPNVGLSIAATGVVAFAFQPVRERVQHLANRLVYGERATPYEVMSGFAARIGGALSIDDALPRMAEAAARGVGAAAVTVRLRLHDGTERSIGWPEEAPVQTSFDRVEQVRHAGEEIGVISVAKRLGESLTPGEVKLLDDLAAQAGLAMHNVRLAVELRARVEEFSQQAAEIRASRQRIVSAQDDERRRLERRIHEGAERRLELIGRGLTDAEGALATRPELAVEVLDRLGTETNETLDGLRELARGIFPPLLADRGLPAALLAQAAKSDVPVEVHAGGIDRFGPDIEAAVYFCCLEALRNAASHAGASGVEVRLAQADGMLSFEVIDDGSGFDPATTPALGGLRNMGDRLAALGGELRVRSAVGAGTTVSGAVPAMALQPAG